MSACVHRHHCEGGGSHCDARLAMSHKRNCKFFLANQASKGQLLPPQQQQAWHSAETRWPSLQGVCSKLHKLHDQRERPCLQDCSTVIQQGHGSWKAMQHSKDTSHSLNVQKSAATQAQPTERTQLTP